MVQVVGAYADAVASVAATVEEPFLPVFVRVVGAAAADVAAAAAVVVVEPFPFPPFNMLFCCSPPLSSSDLLPSEDGLEAGLSIVLIVCAMMIIFFPMSSTMLKNSENEKKVRIEKASFFFLYGAKISDFVN